MNVLVGISFLIFLGGIALRLYRWLSKGIRPTGDTPGVGRRLSAALRSLFSTLFSAKIVDLAKSLLLDVLLQRRLLDRAVLRWIAHSLIFVGFVFLLFMHGLGSGVSEFFFGGSYETFARQQPYISLRNIFGLMVLIGVCLALYRRLTVKPKRVKSKPSDWLSLALVGLIVLSGFLYEGAKLSSYAEFKRMAEEYGGITDPEELLPLETYWAAEEGLVTANVAKPYDPDLVAEGRELAADTCMECHAPASGAFASYSLTPVLGPLAAAIGDRATVTFLFYLHFLSCLALLAWLPFSKMFHVAAVPVSLLINGVAGFREPGTDPANVLNRQMIGLSACTHCGACSEICSALMYYESFQNDFILPSEKVQLLKKIAAGETVDEATVKHLQKGLYVCTSCDRCSMVCPSGINLRELFVSSRYYLLNQGIPETSILSHFSFPLALAGRFIDDHRKALARLEQIFQGSFKKLSELTSVTVSDPAQVGTFSYQSCYSCQRCTNICPVVRLYDDPVKALGMLPHQIIFSLGIGDKELAMGNQMIWSCSTCYLCQEHCPNQVELTDIFYNLKNSAIKKIEAGGSA